MRCHELVKLLWVLPGKSFSPDQTAAHYDNTALYLYKIQYCSEQASRPIAMYFKKVAALRAMLLVVVVHHASEAAHDFEGRS